MTKKRIRITLDDDVVEWLDKQADSRSETINGMLRDWAMLDDPDDPFEQSSMGKLLVVSYSKIIPEGYSRIQVFPETDSISVE